MSGVSDPVAQVSFLVRSETRIDILKHLSGPGSASQRELRERLDASRSTVARSLTALEDRGWVERDDGSYRLTSVGELVVDAFLDLTESLRTIDELAAFLRWFPLSEHEIDLEQLRDARVIAAAGGDPYRPGRTQTEFLAETDRFRGFLPSIDLEGTRFVHDRIASGELEAEVVVSPDVERTIRSGEFARRFREQLRTGRLTVLVSDVDLPFYLGIDDRRRVQIGVEDDEGFPRALLETPADSIADWAERIYRDYREDARVTTADDL